MHIDTRWENEEMSGEFMSVDEYKRRLLAESTKHYSGQHDQSKHGYRFGKAPSLSRARQLKKDGNWEDYVDRARVRRGKKPRGENPYKKGGGASPKQDAQAEYKKKQDALFGEVAKKEGVDIYSSSDVYKLTMADGSVVYDKPVSSLYYKEPKPGTSFHVDYIDKGASFQVAGSDISAHFDLDAVPTAAVKDGRLRGAGVSGVGAILADKAKLRGSQGAQNAALVDYLAGQRDGHEGNYVVDGTKVWSIDLNLGGTANVFGPSFPQKLILGTADNGASAMLFSDSLIKKLRSKQTIPFSSTISQTLQGKIQNRLDDFLNTVTKQSNGMWAFPTEGYMDNID